MTKDANYERSSQQAKEDLINRRNGQGPEHLKFFLLVFLNDGRGSSTNPKESQTSRHIAPTTRAMAKRLDEDWNIATDGRETYLYMFQEVQNQA